MWSNWEVFHTLQGKSWPGENAIAPKPDWPCFYQNYWLCFYQNSSQSPTGCLMKPDKLILNPSRRAKAQNWLGKYWSKNEGMEPIPPNSRSNSMSVILAQRQKNKPMEQDRAQIQTHPSTKTCYSQSGINSAGINPFPPLPESQEGWALTGSKASSEPLSLPSGLRWSWTLCAPGSS